MKGPILAQKRVDSNGILIRFNREIGLRPISISNMTKIPLESTLFGTQNATLHPNNEFNRECYHIYRAYIYIVHFLHII